MGRITGGTFPITTDRIYLLLDSTNQNSYPGTGTTWYDLIGNNNAVMSNISYSLDNFGSFNFNGSSSFAQVPFNSWNFNASMSIMVVMRPKENDGNRRNPFNIAYGGPGTWTHEPGGEINCFYGTSGVNTDPYVSLASSTISQNEWAIMCFTRDPSTVRWYKNGIVTSEGGNPYGASVNTGTSDILIGSGYVSPYLGNINFVAIWNKALTANEVLQTTDAIKYKFNL